MNMQQKQNEIVTVQYVDLRPKLNLQDDKLCHMCGLEQAKTEWDTCQSCQGEDDAYWRNISEKRKALK